ncbi:MAG: histidine kinase [Leptolyngbyaceae cyanobacterium RM2_2_4]|nr:histidine kinase [Leptolyngbyaceae cyanobacterium SM1_4_3]NJN91666.1 histidine kinase [Leptolyngbyaceae cyanobacterium SL_5_14]NJO51962.1 histidine kinase [Leptolyngbyaceae cyanobacterium RM2_2_4]NJO67068.1 histidine kinase [Leptolyngbyaceae cyanobacterium RM1_405_57]
MATIPCHIVVEDNPAIIYASRNGFPAKVLPILNRFLEKFWQERDISGEHSDTPECLVAQIVVRFGFELCEDDFSNLRVGLGFKPDVKYIYQVLLNQTVQVWTPTDAYQRDSSLGLSACQEWVGDGQLSNTLSTQRNSV